MVSSLVRWLGRWVARAAGRSFSFPPPEPTAEDNLGAGI
jgi:hypothetical protein